jgi:TonB family protein
MKLSRRLGLGLLGLVSIAALLRAQDITVQGPHWPLEGEHPEKLPPVKKASSGLAVPAALEKAVEPYYGIGVHTLDQKGTRNGSRQGVTHPALGPLLTASTTEWKFKPAQQDGQPVDATVWTAIIANPASASLTLKNASPRVLAVAPIYVTKKIMGTRQGPQVVRVKVAIDAAGVAGDCVLAPADEGFRGVITKSLPNWKFAPARLDGQPVAGELQLGVLIEQLQRAAVKTTPPKVKHQEAPIYPARMAASGLKGSVLLEFFILEDGSVGNPVVVRSNNPGFDEGAIEAILKWKYEPSTVNGKPVKVRVTQLIEFALDQGDGGREAYEVRGRSAKNQEHLPEHFRYDVPAKPIGVVTPIFPYAMLPAGKTGKAKVVVILNERGLAAVTKVVSASQPEFGLALAAAFEAFAFEPATRAGKPTATLVNMEYEFVFTGDAYEDRRLFRRLEKQPQDIVPATKLDAPPKPLSRRAPVYPQKESFEQVAGEVVIAVVIDEEGKVRLPQIVSATQPEFGYAAVQAVAVWRFEPPKQGGKAVMTRVNIPFAFTPEKRTPRAAKP